MEDFNGEAASKLPLAEAVLQSFAYLTEESFLSDIYEDYRGRTYEGLLSFPTIVGVISDALLEHHGSGHRAILKAEENQELNASMEAVYGKLRRIPESLSQGFLLQGTQRLLKIVPIRPSPVPKSLRMFDVSIIDGKKIKNAAKRLMPTRLFGGSVLGGKVLVAIDPATGMAIAMNSHEDGETNDCPLVPGLIEQLLQLPSRHGRLSVLDRQFCDLKVPALLEEKGFHYLIRYHPKVTFTRDSSRQVKKGKDKEGRWYEQEWGWLGKENDKRRRYVRRITLTRRDEEPLILITDLLDETKYPATDLLELYRMRWGIENVFQTISEVFHLRQLISSTPKGTIFQCAFCLLLYNLIQLERSYVAEAQDLDVNDISLENLFYSAHRQLISWTEMLPAEWTIEYFQKPLTAKQVIQRLRKLLGKVWKDEWMKSKKTIFRPKKEDPPTKGGHTSIYRLIHKNSKT